MSAVTDTDRDKAATAIWGEHGLQEFGDALRAVDALVSIGWRPGGAPVAPTREDEQAEAVKAERDAEVLAKHDAAIWDEGAVAVDKSWRAVYPMGKKWPDITRNPYRHQRESVGPADG